MRFTCTDRGQHSERVLISPYAGTDGRPEWMASANKHLEKGRPESPAAQGPSWLVDGERVPGWSDDLWTFACPSCTRRPRRHKHYIDALFAELQRVGAQKFDTSYLE